YLTLDDYQELKGAMQEAYKSMPNLYWREHQIKTLIDKFPEGQVVIKINNQIAGCALSIIVDYDSIDDIHTYEDITGNYTFNTHDANKGDALYGIDVFIKPEFRGLRLGRRLYDYRKEICEKLNLRGIAFGGRIPNFHKYSKEMTTKEYIDKVRRKEIHDPVLNFQICNDLGRRISTLHKFSKEMTLKEYVEKVRRKVIHDPVLNFQISNDFHPVRMLIGYLEGDNASVEYAVLLEWDNIYYEKPSKKAAT